MLQRTRRKLAGSSWTDQTFAGEDLRNAIADGATFKNCTFSGCKLGQASFRGAIFSQCHFQDCDLRQAVFICTLSDTIFIGCDLDQTIFASAILQRCTFERSRLEYSVFSRATVIGGGFLECQLHGSYLDVAESTGVDFTGSNLWGAVIPLSCAIIPENRFDHRQVHMFLALAGHSAAEKAEIELLKSITDPKMRVIVDRLVARQSEKQEEIHSNVG